jgi:hypothetical protein
MRASEREAFLVFCALGGLDAGGFEERDPPDFVSADGKLGVELVEYHKDIGPRGSKSREREELVWKRLEAGRQRFLELSTGTRMDVFVWLRSGQIPSLEATLKLAEYVAANQGTRCKLRGGSLPEWMSEDFDGVDIFPTWELQEDILWQAPEATNLDPSLEAVEGLLRQKEIKVADYRKEAEAIWLVIHSGGFPIVGDPDGSRPSTCAQIDADLLERVFQSNFDRVYFLDRASRRLERLQVAPSK